MEPESPERDGPDWSACLVGFLASMGTGVVLVPLLLAGWLSTVLSLKLLIEVVIGAGVVAGLISSRRKPSTDHFRLKGPT